MKRAAILIALVALAGCGQTSDEPQAGGSATIEAPTQATSPSPTPTQTQTRQTPSVPAASPSEAPVTRTPKPVQTGAGDVTFCDYLAQNAGAAQQVESPAQFVKLVKGAQAVAPGAIEQDLALYVQSVEKLAATVTADPTTAAKADAWLARNDAAIQQAQDNVNSYSLSTCGQPFITGEGN